MLAIPQKGRFTMARYALMLLAVGFMVGAQAGSDDAVKKERANMAGTWKIVSQEIGGKKTYTDEQLERFLVTFDADGKSTVKLDGKVIVESTNKIDPTKTPKTLDQTFTKGGGGEGKTSFGIYELKDDTLKACFGDPEDGAPAKFRPTEFSSKEGTLVIYKREKGK
jgi:uncharacterized protein (TIGR03067 family)